MPKARILVVDDEAVFRKNLVRSLLAHDYDVRESETAAEALQQYKAFRPDLLLLDLMLPYDLGLNLCEKIRRDSDVPVIVLSVHGEERMKVTALDLGADDYLTKPFGSQELLARIRAVLRRPPATVHENWIDGGGIRIDVGRHQVFVDSDEVRLTPTEFDLLRLLVENQGKIMRHEAILSQVGGAEYTSDAQVLRTYIKQLRAKISDDPVRPRFIRTEPGLGYRFMRIDEAP